MRLPAKVLLVTGDAVAGAALARLVAEVPGIRVCGEAYDAPAALVAIDCATPDAVIVTLNADPEESLDLIARISVGGRPVPVLAVATHDDLLVAERALRAGALGFLTASEAPALVAAALSRMIKREVYVSQRVSTGLVRRLLGFSASHRPRPPVC